MALLYIALISLLVKRLDQAKLVSHNRAATFCQNSDIDSAKALGEVGQPR